MDSVTIFVKKIFSTTINTPHCSTVHNFAVNKMSSFYNNDQKTSKQSASANAKQKKRQSADLFQCECHLLTTYWLPVGKIWIIVKSD